MARFYLVDDEAWTLQSLKSLLNHFSIVDEVRTFEDSRNALKAIESDPPDVLFTDLRMDYLSGRDLISAVRNMGLKIPIIIISAYSDFDAAREAFSFGVLDYLLKPISRASLQSVMERLAQQFQGSAAYQSQSSSDLTRQEIEAAYPECWVLAYRANSCGDRSLIESGSAGECKLMFDQEPRHGMCYAYMSTPTKHLPEGIAQLHMSIGISRPQHGFANYNAMCKEAAAAAQCGVRFAGNKRISEIQAYLILNYEQPLKLDELAARFYMNKTHLCDAFKKECNITVVAFLRDIRMTKAAYLLLNTDETVQNIAASIGYPDGAYFAKLFRKHYGVSPEAYRKK